MSEVTPTSGKCTVATMKFNLEYAEVTINISVSIRPCYPAYELGTHINYRHPRHCSNPGWDEGATMKSLVHGCRQGEESRDRFKS